MRGWTDPRVGDGVARGRVPVYVGSGLRKTMRIKLYARQPYMYMWMYRKAVPRTDRTPHRTRLASCTYVQL